MTTQTPAEAFDSPRDALRSLFNACVAMSQTNKEGAERLLAVHATLARAVEDSERWQALFAGRVRVIGSAGLHSELNPYGKPWDGYAHIGLELWTKHPGYSEQSAVDDLRKYGDIARTTAIDTARGVGSGA